MIQKLDKDKKVLASWPTIEDAAKAIKLSPKVLKGHIFNGKPKRLDGFTFVSTVVKEIIGNIEPLPPVKPLVFQQHLKNKSTGKITPLKDTIVYTTPSPAFFDGEKLSSFTADEAGMFPTDMRDKAKEIHQTIAKAMLETPVSVFVHNGVTQKDIEEITKVMNDNPGTGPTMVLDEFGDPVELAPEDVEALLGHESLPVEAVTLTPEESEFLQVINPDWLLTPLQRRLKDL